jgi:hypothetical protein
MALARSNVREATATTTGAEVGVDRTRGRSGRLPSGVSKWWSEIRNALHTTQQVDICSSGVNKKLCTSSVEYFVNKIRSIKDGIASTLAGTQIDALYTDVKFTGTPGFVLQPASFDEVRKFTCSMMAKSSPMDRIPTSIIKC